MKTKEAKNNQITRKEALTKLSKYTALTALGTFLILSPLEAQASSPPDPGSNPLD
ncbi:hypothetical protein [Winogradskyella sp.]|uniref:hypothetical protein n=1 Tax=Winogradskyella sp. TaxID=1883156 RepID=UPI003BA94488